MSEEARSSKPESLTSHLAYFHVSQSKSLCVPVPLGFPPSSALTDRVGCGYGRESNGDCRSTCDAGCCSSTLMGRRKQLACGHRASLAHPKNPSSDPVVCRSFIKCWCCCRAPFSLIVDTTINRGRLMTLLSEQKEEGERRRRGCEGESG